VESDLPWLAGFIAVSKIKEALILVYLYNKNPIKTSAKDKKKLG
jgi:hypothetical protein